MISSHQEDTPAHLLKMLRTQKARSGFSLDNYFYQSERVYKRELEQLLFQSWLFAAHVSEIPKPGDFVLLEIANESIIISRDAENQIHALHNICRHRGSRVCDQQSGNSKTFVCPYHGWVYENNGMLRPPREAQAYDDLALKDYALKSIKLEVFMGLIFVNFNQDAPDFTPTLEQIGVQLGAYDLANAKIAYQETYQINANWKLVLENYLECYHCASSHKFYARSHSLKAAPQEVAVLNKKMLARAEKTTGVAGIGRQLYRVYQDAEGFGACISHNRYALYDGYLTGSQDGNALAPLMGGMLGYDGGAGDFQMGPVSFMLNYPDHCVLYRFTPRAINQTDMKLVWFVKGDAREGVDYEVDKLTWLWHQTSLEDKDIIMRNSAGVHSSFYQPGPLHPEFEGLLMQFVDWYICNLTE